MMTRHVPQAAAKKTMRGVIFTVLQTGQRHKHENELKRLGFDVESRDFPKTFNLNAYEIIFIVKDHAPNNEQENAEHAARLSGKPWFRITKKTSNPTWEAVKTFAHKSGLTPVEDANSHEPSLSVKPFAIGFADYIEKRADADDWAKLASEYEATAKSQEERADSLETMWNQAEADLKEMRKRIQAATEDANSAAAQREALRAEVERLQKELTTLTTAKAIGRKAVAAVDDSVLKRLADTDTLLRQARAERDQVKEELATAKKETMQALKSTDARTDIIKQSTAVIQGLQDEIDKLNKQLTAKPPMMPSTVVAAEIPAGKKLVPANIEQTAEKLYSLWEDGVLDIEEVWAKLMQQLKGE